MLARERHCTVKNRVRELRSPGTVRDEGSNVLVYSDRLQMVAKINHETDIFRAAAAFEGARAVGRQDATDCAEPSVRGVTRSSAGVLVPEPSIGRGASAASPTNRSTTDLAVRDQMSPAAYVAEGYGPGAVVMCVPVSA